jgi:hypothetical protein
MDLPCRRRGPFSSLAFFASPLSAGGESGAAPAAGGRADLGQGLIEAAGRAGMRGREFGQPLGERLSQAVGRYAEEAVEEQEEPEKAAVPGQFGRRLNRAAVWAQRDGWPQAGQSATGAVV